MSSDLHPIFFILVTAPMNRLIHLIICLILFTKLPAQNFSLLWANRTGGPSYDEGRSITVDASGNSYVTGVLGGFTDNAIIVKYDAAGNVVWSETINPSSGQVLGDHIEVDGGGNVYLCGSFSGPTDFDPGTGSYVLTPNNPHEIFLLKLNSSGNFVWAKQMGGHAFNTAASVSLDAGGNIFVTGTFDFSADFDPGTAVYTMTSAGQTDIFITKLDPSGNFVWAKRMGGTGNDYCFTIENDSNGNILIGGSFCQTVDFDPGPGTNNLTAAPSDFYEIFIAKYDPSGNFVWAKQMYGPNGADYCRSLAVDGSGNVYATGAFASTVDFNPGSAVQNLTAVGDQDIFICKLDYNGNFSWARGMGTPTQDYGKGISVDGNGNVFYTGAFSGAGDFDPGPGACIFTCNGTEDAIISEFDQFGNFEWATQISGSDRDEGNYVVPDAAGNIYAVGFFMNTADFDPCSTVYNMTSFGQYDIYTVKYGPNPNIPSVTISTPDTVVCPGGSASFTASPINTGSVLSYQWQVDNINAGTNAPTFTATNLQVGDFVQVIMTCQNACSGNSIVYSNAIFVHVVPPSPASVTIGTASTAVCAGAATTFSASPVNGGSSPAYQWQLNGANVGTNSSTYTTSSLSNGDVVTVIMTSNSNCVTGSPATSNPITVTVSSGFPASVNMVADTSNICSGTNVSFTATSTNGGSTPLYQWQINGSNVGTNAANYSSTNLANGDVIKVIMTSSIACATGSPATSNAVTMNVTSSVTPRININADSTSICSGSTINFTSVQTGGGPSPLYQWLVNGTNAGSGAMFSSGNLANGDVIKCRLVSNAACASPDTVISNIIPVTVKNYVTPTITINSSPSIICEGTPVLFNATATNGGGGTTYQWQVNGVNVGNNNSLYSSTTLVNGDVIKCIMTSNLACVTTNNIPSNNIVVVIDLDKCPKGFWAPAAFTPNHDGKNDFYRPLVFGNIVQYKFTIYNRWGEKIFETSDPQQGWDGKIKGREQDSNVFIWVATYQISGETKKEKKGSFILIR